MTETEQKNYAACVASIRATPQEVEEVLILVCEDCGHRWPRKFRILHPTDFNGRSPEQQRAEATSEPTCGACKTENSARVHESLAKELRAKAAKLREQQKRAAERRLGK